jgi:hypothetical protein
MQKDYLILKRALASRSSGQWSDDDFDVLCDGAVVGRIFKANAAPVGSAWMWTVAFGHHEDRAPTHGYAETREAAIGGIRKELAAAVSGAGQSRAGNSATGASTGPAPKTYWRGIRPVGNLLRWIVHR